MIGTCYPRDSYMHCPMHGSTLSRWWSCSPASHMNSLASLLSYLHLSKNNNNIVLQHYLLLPTVDAQPLRVVQIGSDDL